MKFRAKMIAGCGGGLIILLCVGALTYRRSIQRGADQRWVAHSHLVRETLDATLLDTMDAETDERGYLATGDSLHLSFYGSARARIRGDLRSLRALTEDNAEQQASLDRLEPLVAARFAPFDAGSAARGRAGFTPAESSAELNSEKQPADAIRAAIASMDRQEQQLLDNRLRAMNAASRRIRVLIVVGNALGFLFLALAGVFIHQEMRKREMAEESLRLSEQRLRLLVSGVRDYAIFMLDPEGRVASWNRGAERINGYRAEEIIGKHFSVFHPSEDVERGKPLDELTSAANEGRYEDEGWRVRKNGSRFWASVVITAMRDDAGRLHGFGKVTRDLTASKKLEEEMDIRNAQLEAANQELEAFSYSVSHDLRAPLRGIDGFSQALLEDYGGKMDETAKGHLSRVRAGAQRMAQLIDDLLNLSRVTRAPISRETVDLSATARTIAEELRSISPRREVEVLVEPGIEAGADPQLLRIALENLIGNAWKFTSKRDRARIEFGCHRGEVPAYFVRDNGAGFDPAYSNRLFGAFQRLHRMEEFPGTGVGLASVKRIIRRHGGRVWAEAAVDKGATFYFTLEPQPSGKEKPADADAGKSDSAGGRQS
ncbi:MAG: sensor histidine kinase [Candidatus Acidiferrales bacterium]